MYQPLAAAQRIRVPGCRGRFSNLQRFYIQTYSTRCIDGVPASPAGAPGGHRSCILQLRRAAQN